MTVAAMARDAVAFIRAMGFDQVDLLGFSLGGFVAQEIALTEPALVRRLILTGTGPAGGKGIDRVTGLWRDCRRRFGAAGANGAGPFLFGGFCIADAMYAPVCTRFRTYQPRLSRVAQTYCDAMLADSDFLAWEAQAKADPPIDPMLPG